MNKVAILRPEMKVTQEVGVKYVDFRIANVSLEGDSSHPSYYLETTNKRGKKSGFWSQLRNIHSHHIEQIKSDNTSEAILEEILFEVGEKVSIVDAYGCIGTVTRININYRNGVEFYVSTITEDYEIISNWYTASELRKL